MRVVSFSIALATTVCLACNVKTNQPSLDGKDVHVTFLHTSDIHSRLLPYYMKVAKTDENIGLDDANAPFGGVARISHIIQYERERANRSLYIDTGDVFQGAPIFNVFSGEVEMKALSAMNLDVMVVGNHDFDLGEPILAQQIASWANFPILAANYKFAAGQSPTPPPLAGLVQEYAVFNLQGLRVGVIGLGNTSTMSTIIESGNNMGITPIDAAEAAQFYIDAIRSQVDVVILATHLGLTDDYELIKNITGADIVFGGHHHVVLNPPKVLQDCQIDQMVPVWRERFTKSHTCTPRNVILVHSGAFAKYVGRLDVVFRQKEVPGNDWEVASSEYKAIPVDASVAKEPLVEEMLEKYRDVLNQAMQLDLILGYAPATVARFGTYGGDSQLGNVVADSMRKRKGVETDFALTNSLGIRSDIYAGPVTVDDMYNVFPFENTIVTMYLSGREVVEMFDYLARRTGVRGCQTQAQISGARVVLQCGRCDASMRPAEWTAVDPDAEGCAYSIEILGEPVSLDSQYQVAVNDYISKGGSGFMVLKRNTTQINTGIPLREALMDTMRQGKACGSLDACTTDADCNSQNYTCACDARSAWDSGSASCTKGQQCEQGAGVCVLSACVTDVSTRFVANCAGGTNTADYQQCACEQTARAMSQCGSTACIDPSNGFLEDERIKTLPP